MKEGPSAIKSLIPSHRECSVKSRGGERRGLTLGARCYVRF
jgi:hypothetical protein